MNNEVSIISDIRSCIESGLSLKIQTLLSSVSEEDAVKILNQQLPDGMTLLHLAVGQSENDIRVVRTLIENGADPNNTSCDEKVSPLHLSILYELDLVLDFLLKNGGDPFIPDGEGKNCYDLVENVQEADILKSILIKHSSFSGISSIGSDGTAGETTGSASYMTCVTSVSDQDKDRERACFFTEDEDESVVDPKRKRFGILSTINEETSSIMKRCSPNSTRITHPDTRKGPPDTLGGRTPDRIQGHTPDKIPGRTPDPISQYYQVPFLRGRPELPNKNSNSSFGSSPTHSFASTPSTPPSPTSSELDALHMKLANLNVNLPVTPSTYYTISKFVSPMSAQALPMSKLESQYSSELQKAIEDISIIDRLKYGDLKVEIAQDAEEDSPKRNGKSYYNYVLLDPKVIKRINFSGDHLKSDVIRSSEKFRKFISAIFYIGKGCGKRPIQHLEEAKVALVTKRKQNSEKIQKILDIWKSGQAVIVHSFFHHSSEREANVNEASMIDAMGLSELSNMKKGSYSGARVSEWTQKQKNQFGVFLLRTCFSLFAVSSGTANKEIFPRDI